MEFKAEVKDGIINVKPIIERKGNDVTVHVPSFKLIEELKRKEGKGDYKHTKRVKAL